MAPDENCWPYAKRCAFHKDATIRLFHSTAETERVIHLNEWAGILAFDWAAVVKSFWASGNATRRSASLVSNRSAGKCQAGAARREAVYRMGQFLRATEKTLAMCNRPADQMRGCWKDFRKESRQRLAWSRDISVGYPAFGHVNKGDWFQNLFSESNWPLGQRISSSSTFSAEPIPKITRKSFCEKIAAAAADFVDLLVGFRFGPVMRVTQRRRAPIPAAIGFCAECTNFDQLFFSDECNEEAAG